MAQLEPGDVVVATNNESLPITIKYNKREYKLTPNVPVFIPFEAACLWYGDPRSVGDIKSYTGLDGLVAFIPDRATEVRRLRQKYGAVYGDDRQIAGSFKDDPDNPGHPGDPIFIPDVTITTPEGDKLWMVVEDPFGDHAETAIVSVSSNQDMLAQLKRQQAQIDLLLAQMNGTEAEGIPTLSDEGDLVPPTDDDTQPKAVSK